jgi:hypothetical protein
VKEWASKTWEQALEDVMLLVFKLRSEEKLQCCPRRRAIPYSWEASCHIAGKLLILKKCQPTGRASLQRFTYFLIFTWFLNKIYIFI